MNVAMTSTKKLTKAQQTLFERIQSGEKISKRFACGTWHDSHFHAINRKTVWSLYKAKLIDWKSDGHGMEQIFVINS